MQVLESEVRFHNASGFDSGPQHILLGGHISTVGYPVQVIQVALGGEKTHRKKLYKNVCRLRAESAAPYAPTRVTACASTHYAAESLS